MTNKAIELLHKNNKKVKQLLFIVQLLTYFFYFKHLIIKQNTKVISVLFTLPSQIPTQQS
jgi:hypothetical protein